MQWLSTFSLFLAQLVSLVAGVLVVVAGVAAIIASHKKKTPRLSIQHLNEQFDDTTQAIQAILLTKKERKRLKKNAKKDKKSNSDERPRLFVIDFHGDIKASAVCTLREEVTAIILTAQPKDEVLVKIDSAGGMVPHYGLGAAQLQRLRHAELQLTVAVDKVAASGGYMMATVAHHIIAAPFALVGSIGVVAQVPNFFRWMKHKHIDFEQFTAGDYKRTVTMLADNKKKDREKFQEELDDTHTLFKDFITQHRSLDVQKVATGEHWYGQQAISLQLIDDILTSDDYILKKAKTHNIYQVKVTLPKKAMRHALKQTWDACLSGQIFHK